jgi:hypothetical protein
MKTRTKPVYYCEHCKKHGLSKPAMEHHENICHKNPENFRPCFDCVRLTKKRTTIFHDYPDGSQSEIPVDILYCQAHNKFLHTPQNEIRGNVFDLGDYLNEPMPKECLEQVDYETYHGNDLHF